MIDTSRSMLYHMSNLNKENGRIAYQTATGKNMENGSENSLLHADLINLDDKLRVTEGVKNQIEKTNVFNDTSDTNIGDIKKALDAIKIDLMKGLNDGMDRSDKTALSSNLEGVRQTLIDRLNTEVNGEYLFAGSFPSKQTIVKDSNFDDNGKIEFGGDGFLREIAVQPGSYRDRGVTAYDVSFYNSDTATAFETLSFSEGERILDNKGNEWKLNDNKNRLQKYDYNGVIIEPKEEITVKTASEEIISVKLDVGANTDALGDYTIKLKDDSGTIHTYSYTAKGDSTSAPLNGGAGYSSSLEEIFNNSSVDKGIMWQIEQDFPGSVSRDGDTLVINPTDSKKISIEISETDTKYGMVAENEIEADDETQSKPNTYEASIPGAYKNDLFEAKHNYFDDLNKVINALDGYSTKLDGTRGPVATDDLVEEITRTVLGQTKSQFDATNVGHGKLGGRNKVFEVAYEKIQTQETHYTLLSTQFGSSDKTKLALESKMLDLTYQSLYSTISKMNSMSLVNYVK